MMNYVNSIYPFETAFTSASKDSPAFPSSAVPPADRNADQFVSGDHPERKCYEERLDPLLHSPVETMIKKVIFNGSCTVVLWVDGMKTIVRCDRRDDFDQEKGLAMAIVKRFCGNKGSYYEIFKEHAQAQ